MRNLLFFVFLMVVAVFPAQAASKRAETIAAIVNTRAITASDLDDRMRMIMSSAGLPGTQDVLARVRPQVLSSLIEEQIKLQEAERLKIKIEPADLDRAIAEIARQNKMTYDQFKQMFRARGLPMRSLRNQIQAQIAWMKVVTREIRPQIEISETDIDAELNQLKARVGQDEFRLAEIVLAVDRPQDAKNVDELAARLVAQIRKNPASFPALAQQFSRAPGAAQGGDMGWVSPDQLPSDIQKQLQATKVGDIIGPYKTLTGLHMMLVRDRRARAAENLPNRDMIADKIGMERLDRMQRRYYLDLRSSSFVETRL